MTAPMDPDRLEALYNAEAPPALALRLCNDAGEMALAVSTIAGVRLPGKNGDPAYLHRVGLRCSGHVNVDGRSIVCVNPLHSPAGVTVPAPPARVMHGTPAENGATPCCGLPPDWVPELDGMTADPALVTCTGYDAKGFRDREAISAVGGLCAPLYEPFPYFTAPRGGIDYPEIEDDPALANDPEGVDWIMVFLLVVVVAALFVAVLTVG